MKILRKSKKKNRRFEFRGAAEGVVKVQNQDSTNFKKKKTIQKTAGFVTLKKSCLGES